MHNQMLCLVRILHLLLLHLAILRENVLCIEPWQEYMEALRSDVNSLLKDDVCFPQQQGSHSLSLSLSLSLFIQFHVTILKDKIVLHLYSVRKNV